MELTVEEALAGEYLFVDLRSEKEYGDSHIPFANSLPLLDDEARKIVGIAYKQESRQRAIELGYEHVLPKLAYLEDKVEDFLEKGEVIFYCSRGGMRSTSLYELFSNRKGVHILKGGYKAYRNYLLEELPRQIEKRDFIVFQGLTGVGKTKLLKKLNDFYSVLDLEKLASHRGSVFGGLGLGEQPSQKQFENGIFHFFLKAAGLVLVESESSKIGRLLLPREIREKILSSPVFMIEASLDFRVRLLEEEYGVKLKENKEELVADIWRLKSKLGYKACESLEGLLRQDKMAQAIELLLTNYYDPLYMHSIDQSSIRVRAVFDASQDDIIKQIGRKIDEILYS